MICLNALEENKRVHDKVNALTNLSQPHGVFWTDKSKADVVVKFQDRVEQVHGFFDKCRASLAMVWGTMFPLNPLPPMLLALMAKFKDSAKVRTLVRNQLLAGAEVEPADSASTLPAAPRLRAGGPQRPLPAALQHEPVDSASTLPAAQSL
jgi:hypothetical protein